MGLEGKAPGRAETRVPIPCRTPQPPVGSGRLAMTCGPRSLPLPPMGLTHCPLCVGLALLCLVRSAAHAALLWRLLAGSPSPRLAALST